MFQAPSEKTRVSGGDENSGTQERIGVCDQRLDIGIAFAHRVTEKTYDCGIRYDSVFSLGNNRCALLDCVTDLAVAVVSMYESTKSVALVQI